VHISKITSVYISQLRRIITCSTYKSRRLIHIMYYIMQYHIYRITSCIVSCHTRLYPKVSGL